MAEDEDPPGDRAVAADDPGVIEAIRIDLGRLYRGWMGLLFPRQRRSAHAVLGPWRPSTVIGTIKYRFWGALSVPVIALVYPLAVIGFAARFHARRLDRSAARIGVIGVLLVSLLVWGGLTAVARVRFPYGGFVAVAAAGGVATLSAVLARLFTRGGRFTSVLLGYPFAVTGLFLPPVVAALNSPAVADVVLTGSDRLAIYLLDNVLDIYGLNDMITDYFDLEGLAYVGMWFGIAVPLGWVLGVLVSLANLVRPSRG